MRDRLLRLLHEQPGINKSRLCLQLGVAWGTVDYHVSILAEAGLVHVESAGREANLYPRGLADDRRRMVKALREPTAHQVLEALGRVRESYLQDLSAQLGLSRKVVRRHLVQLVAAGLVEDKGTRRARYAVVAGVVGAAGAGVTAGAAQARPDPRDGVMESPATVAAEPLRVAVLVQT